MGTPWTNRLVFIHHFKWNLIILLIVTWWSNGRMWGFQTDNRHICRGRKCNLPRIIKSAAALSLPKRERKVHAETWVWERNILIVRIRSFTRSAGTLTISGWVRNSIPINVNLCAGIKSDLFRFGMKPRFWTIWRVYFVWEISRLRIRSLINQSSRYGKRDTAPILKCAATTFINCMKMYGLRDIPNGKAVNWNTWCSKTKQRYFLDIGCIGIWRYASVRSMETAQSLALIDCLTESPFWNDVCLCTDLAAKDLLLVVTFHSFSVQGISESKNREFPDSEPIPLPVFWEALRFLLAITGRKIDSILLEQPIKEELTWRGSWTRFRW